MSLIVSFHLFKIFTHDWNVNGLFILRFFTIPSRQCIPIDFKEMLHGEQLQTMDKSEKLLCIINKLVPKLKSILDTLRVSSSLFYTSDGFQYLKSNSSFSTIVVEVVLCWSLFLVFFFALHFFLYFSRLEHVWANFTLCSFNSSYTYNMHYINYFAN